MAEKDTDEKLDRIAGHLDSLHKKMDAADEERKADRARMDALDEWRSKSDAAEKEREDKLRKDAEESEAEEREETDSARRDALKAGHKLEMRDDVEGYMEGGEFHPIRGSKGYKRSEAGEGRRSRRRRDSAESDDKEREDREREDRARKDAEEKAVKEREEKDRADRARNDSLATEVAALKALLPAQHSPEDKSKFSAAQMRADKAYQAWGLGQAPPSLMGESLRDYRLRLALPLKQYSRAFKDSALETIGDEGAFSTVEDSIINDAVTASISTVVEGAPLRKATERNESGHMITKWYGDPAVCWAPFMGGAVRITKLQRPATK